MALTKITTSVIAANTLGTANIADNSIDATKIAANSILTRHIDDDQITGDQLADNITIAGNLTVTGNLTTNGSSVTNSSTNTTIEDTLIELGTGTSGSPSNDSGIILERGSSDNIFIGFDESADKVMVATTSATGASTGNLTLTAAPLVTGALTASGLSYPTSDGSSGQVIKTDGSGALSFSNISTSTSVSNYTATGDGSTTAFDTGTNPTDEINTWVFVDGVYQQKSVYSYSGSTITFATAPESGAKIDVVTGVTTGIQDSETVLGVFEATTTNTATYATSLNAAHENNTWVFVGGVYQPKDSYTFSTSGSLVFDANTPVGEKLAVVTTKALTASAVTTDSIAASAVTTAKIADNAITSAKIPNNSIVGADISATTNITANTFTGALTGNVTGNVTGNLTGTVQTAAQTNITSVGTLTSFRSTGIDDNADAIAITIDSSERVGIGTTSPGHGLDVQYTTSSGTSDAIANFGTSGSGNWANSGHQVIIGGPSVLTYTGLIIHSDSTSGNGQISFADGRGASDSWRGVVAYNHASDYMHFWTNANERMRIDSSGKVGIGTSSPTGSIHVTTKDSNGSDVYYVAQNTTSNRLAGYKIFDESGNVGGVFQYDNGSNALNIGTAINTYFSFNTNNTERMRINSSGQLGIACTDQSNLLTVDANSASAGTDSISVRNRGVTGTTHTTGLRFQFNTAVPAAIRSRLTNTSNGEGTLSFFTSSDGTAGNLSEKMTIISGGDVCIGKTTNDIDTQGWHVIGAGTYSGSVYSGITGAVSTSTYHLRDTTNNTWKFYVENNGTIRAISTSISALSDERLKENVVDLETGLTEVMSLKPRRFDWKEGEGSNAKNVAGFIAQEVETVLPDLIDDFMHDDLDDAKSVKMSDMIPTLVKAIQELSTEVEELKAKLESK